MEYEENDGVDKPCGTVCLSWAPNLYFWNVKTPECKPLDTYSFDSIMVGKLVWLASDSLIVNSDDWAREPRKVMLLCFLEKALQRRHEQIIFKNGFLDS